VVLGRALSRLLRRQGLSRGRLEPSRHGGSSASKPIRFVSLADYVEDVVTVAESMPIPPVVIGHSMGGSLVQKYLETHQAPAGVLLASTPPRGNPGFNMRWLKRHPWHFTTAAMTGKTLHRVNTPELAREKFFLIQRRKPM
jgi:pimeloyl-ACP methyl ester carboxylesterase